MKNAVSVSRLSKSFRGKEVLKDVSFTVPRGTTYALLGANGAGKTTTVRILATQLKADGGWAEIAGYDISGQTREVRGAISLTGQFSAVDEALTGKENLLMMAKLWQVSDPEKNAEKLLRVFGLTQAEDQRVSVWSGGMKRKLDIAMSLIGNPQVVFLDEPTTGLDPQSRRSMWDMIRRLNREGITIFLTTQYLEEAEQLADRIAILHHGRILAEGTAGELKARLPRGTLRLVFENTETLKKAEVLLEGFQTAAEGERGLAVYTDGKADTTARIFYLLYRQDIHVQDYSQTTPNLEDVFLAMTSEGRIL